jgi:hypothetical protein
MLKLVNSSSFRSKFLYFYSRNLVSDLFTPGAGHVLKIHVIFLDGGVDKGTIGLPNHYILSNSSGCRRRRNSSEEEGLYYDLPTPPLPPNIRETNSKSSAYPAT